MSVGLKQYARVLDDKSWKSFEIEEFSISNTGQPLQNNISYIEVSRFDDSILLVDDQSSLIYNDETLNEIKYYSPVFDRTGMIWFLQKDE